MELILKYLLLIFFLFFNLIFIKAENNKECYLLEKIDFWGNESIKNKEIENIVNSYVSKCLTENEINALILKPINTLYQKKGYVFNNAKLNLDRINQGILKIIIIERSLDGFELKSNTLQYSNLNWAFLGLRSKSFNKSDLFEGLNNLNNYSNHDININFLSGKTEKSLILEVEALKKPKKYNFLISSTNEYTFLNEPIDLRNGTFGLGFDTVNFILPNDIFILRNFYNIDKKQLKEITTLFNYGLPLGSYFAESSNVFTYFYYYSPYEDKYILDRSSRPIISIVKTRDFFKSYTFNNNVKLSKNLIFVEDKTLKVNLQLSNFIRYFYKNNKLQELEDQKTRNKDYASTSSYSLQSASVGLDYLYLYNNIYNFAFNAKFTQGYPVLGQKKIAYNTNDNLSNIFSIFYIEATNSFKISNKVQYINNINLQFSDAILDSNYSINISSSSGVRGYKGISSFTTNTALIVQNTIQYTPFTFNNKYINSIYFSFGFDTALQNDPYMPPLFAYYLQISTSGKYQLSIGLGQPVFLIPQFKLYESGLKKKDKFIDYSLTVYF